MAASESMSDLIILEPLRRFARLNLGELWARRELVYFFVWRDLKVRYKQSVIGAAWAAVQPLLLMVVFTLFFGRLAKIPSGGVPSALFYFSGVVPWTYFPLAVTNATTSIVDNRAIITKVYFPRLVFPIAAVASHLVDLVIGFVLLITMAAASGRIPGSRALLLPFFIGFEVLTAFVAGVWFSALNARYRDVRYLVTFLVYVWTFVSPVVYPSSLVPGSWRIYYALNPMTTVIDGVRWALVGTTPPLLAPSLISALTMCCLAIGGLVYFRRNESAIVDVV